jgi:hypothetical protein
MRLRVANMGGVLKPTRQLPALILETKETQC